MASKRWDEADKLKVISLHRHGMESCHIAERFGCTVRAVHDIIHKRARA